MKLKSLIFNFRRWFILHGDCPKRFLKRIRFFSEVRNVEEKKIDLLVYYFICVCHSEPKCVLKP